MILPHKNYQYIYFEVVEKIENVWVQYVAILILYLILILEEFCTEIWAFLRVHECSVILRVKIQRQYANLLSKANVFSTPLPCFDDIHCFCRKILSDNFFNKYTKMYVTTMDGLKQNIQISVIKVLTEKKIKICSIVTLFFHEKIHGFSLEDISLGANACTINSLHLI